MTALRGSEARLTKDAGVRAGGTPDGVLSVIVLALGVVVCSEPSKFTSHFGLHWNMLLFALAVVAWVFAGRRETLGRGILLPVFFLGWAWFSASWSESPSDTTKAVESLALVIATGVLLASCMSISQIVRGLFLGFVLAAAVSVASVFLFPTRGLVTEDYHVGAIRGIYSHRNQLGYAMALGIATGAMTLSAVKSQRKIVVVAMAAMAIIGVRTYSATALAMTLVALTSLTILWIARRARAQARAALVFALIAFAVLGLGTLKLADVTGAFGRDSTLTNRTEIWPLVIQQWKLQPWSGYGWGAAWLDQSGPQLWISGALNTRVFHSHDSYLDVLLQVGVIGLVIFAAMVLRALWSKRALLLAIWRGEAPVYLAAPEILIAVMAVYSVVEVRISAYLGFFLLAISLSRSVPGSGSLERSGRDYGE